MNNIKKLGKHFQRTCCPPKAHTVTHTQCSLQLLQQATTSLIIIIWSEGEEEQEKEDEEEMEEEEEVEEEGEEVSANQHAGELVVNSEQWEGEQHWCSSATAYISQQ